MSNLRAARMESAVPIAFMAQLTVKVQRRSGGSFIDISNGGDVGISEPVRYTAQGGSGWPASTHFLLLTPTGVEDLGKISQNFAGNAWIDTIGPSKPGHYALEVDGPTGILGKPSFDRFDFYVSEDAAPPPEDAPPGGLPKLPKLPDVTEFTDSLTTLVLVAGGVFLAVTLFGKRR